MRFLFIINPSSGRKSNDQVAERIDEVMKAKNLEHQILYTSGKDDDKEITKAIKSFIPDRVIACGGDGTIQLVVRNLLDVNIPMGILQLGSANGLAKALDLPSDLDDALELFTDSAVTIPLDALKVNGHICVHLSDIGTNALLVKNYEEAGDKGMLGYAKHLISAIQESEAMHYKITTPDGVFEKEGFMLAMANANKYGTGVLISEGSVSDGKFEICNVQKIDLESAVKAGLTAINVFVDDDMFSDVISCTSATITIDRDVHLQVDGEYMGTFNTLDVHVIPGAVQVLVKP